MTCVNQTFVPSPKSRLGPPGVDPISVMHTPAMVKHGKDTSSDVRVPYIFTKQNKTLAKAIWNCIVFSRPTSVSKAMRAGGNELTPHPQTTPLIIMGTALFVSLVLRSAVR